MKENKIEYFLNFRTHLFQVHLVGVVPGLEELAGALLLQRDHHDVKGPGKQGRGTHIRDHSPPFSEFPDPSDGADQMTACAAC